MRVEFFGPDGRQWSLLASCTDLSGEDPYKNFTDGPALFRLPELMVLCEITKGLKESQAAVSSDLPERSERQNTPDIEL